jgi:hypothetical protein
MIFQYSEGVRFVGEAYRRGGWNAVNALYASPPQSSQQIAKPGLYFDHPTLPADIRLSGYQQLLPGWTNADDNTLGQLLLSVILKRGLGEKAPQVRLAENWAGDRMITMRNGTALTIIWYLVFANDLGAEQFAAAYTTVLDSLLTRETTHRVDYRGNAVLVLIGESARHFTRMAPAIWQATQVVRPTPPPSLPNRAHAATSPFASSH